MTNLLARLMKSGVSYESQKVINELEDEAVKKAFNEYLDSAVGVTYWFGAAVGVTSTLVGILVGKVAEEGYKKYRRHKLIKEIEKRCKEEPKKDE